MTTKALKKITLPVEGMTCAACVSHVEGALREVGGVARVAVNLAMEQATVEFDPERATIPELLEAVDDSGYKAGLALITLNIGGMTCAACVSHVGNALREVDGVVSASVNLATEQATVEYVPGLAALPDMKAMVDDAGYTVDGCRRRGMPKRARSAWPAPAEVRALDSQGHHCRRGRRCDDGHVMYIPLETLRPDFIPTQSHTLGTGHTGAVLDWGNLLSERLGVP